MVGQENLLSLLKPNEEVAPRAPATIRLSSLQSGKQHLQQQPYRQEARRRHLV